MLVVKNSSKFSPNSCNSFCASDNEYFCTIASRLTFGFEDEVYTFEI